METLTRGQVARRAGIGIEAVRFYERRGLVPEPPRTKSGYRQYPSEVVHRIRFIRRAQEIGFSLEEISELLQLRVDPSTDCGDVRERAVTKLQEVEGKIRDLQRIRAVLSELATSCAGLGPATECPILEALDAAEEERGGAAGRRFNSSKEERMAKRTIEIFTAGCACCDEAVQLVRSIACPSCDVQVLDMKRAEVAERAKALGVRSVPAVAVNGRLAGCCAGRGPTEEALREAGVGQAL